MSREYNSQTVHSCTAENVKSLWEYIMKKRPKGWPRGCIESKRGGPVNSRKVNPLNSKIISLIKTIAVERFDSDSVASESLECHNVAEAQVILPVEPKLCNKDLKTDIDEIQKTGIDFNEVVMQMELVQ